MTVSSGTYVRSIVHDIGLALGCGAHVVKLTRTRQGEFVLRGDEEELAAIDDIKAAVETASHPGAKAAPKPQLISEEEAANGATNEEEAANAASFTSKHPALAHPSGPTTSCIPWSVFEAAIAERNAAIAVDKLGREEAAPHMTTAELEANFGAAARIARSRTDGLKTWEVELLRRFVPVPMPVVRDSKSRAAGIY
jgi:tRNA pseudouridine55 synthase